jgi:hypothetical protein
VFGFPRYYKVVLKSGQSFTGCRHFKTSVIEDGFFTRVYEVIDDGLGLDVCGRKVAIPRGEIRLVILHGKHFPRCILKKEFGGVK